MLEIVRCGLSLLHLIWTFELSACYNLHIFSLLDNHFKKYSDGTLGRFTEIFYFLRMENMTQGYKYAAVTSQVVSGDPKLLSSAQCVCISALSTHCLGHRTTAVNLLLELWARTLSIQYVSIWFWGTISGEVAHIYFGRNRKRHEYNIVRAGIFVMENCTAESYS